MDKLGIKEIDIVGDGTEIENLKNLSKGKKIKFLGFKDNINEIVAKEIVKSLDATDFSKYFDDTAQWGCDLWAFGKDVNNEEIYIKNRTWPTQQNYSVRVVP
jgi:hypothetical protein